MLELSFFVWLLVCYFFLVWRVERRQRRVDSLRDELGIGIVSKFHDKPIPFNKLDKDV
jgi:HAMP domain-containing protein